MERQFSNNLAIPANNWLVQDPYYFIRIDSIDNADIQWLDVAAMNYSGTRVLFSSIYYGANTSTSGITFTYDMTLPKAGKYFLEIYGVKRSGTTADMTVSIGGSQILAENMYNAYNIPMWITTPIFDVTDVSNKVNLSIYVPVQAYIAYIRIIPITQYQGGKNYIGDTEHTLDILNIDFTQNGVSEVDEATIEVAFKESYFTEDNPYSRMFLDAWDPITIYIGSSMRETLPVFGGYINGYSLSDDMSTLTINALDSIYGMSRTYVPKNFYIGTKPTTSGQSSYSSFTNVNKIAEFLAVYGYKINIDTIAQDYALDINFGSSSNITDMTNDGWNVTYDTAFGNPGNSMKLQYASSDYSSLTIYEDTGGLWDASEYGYFSFDYYMSGLSAYYPVCFNIEIDMYGTDEVYSDAVTYRITCNSNTTTGTFIGSMPLTANGSWHTAIIDLNTAFDKYAPSGNYYITAIRIVSTPSVSDIANAYNSAVWIDNILGYKAMSNAPQYVSADSKTALAELQDLCEKCNHVAYVRPGEERYQDQLILIPNEYYTLPISVEEGKNLISISGVDYKPLDWGLATNAHVTYTSNNKYYSQTYTDTTARNWYGNITEHEYTSDITTQAGALTEAKSLVNNKSYWYPSFTVTLSGNTLFEPGQFIYCNIPSRRLQGAYPVASISQSLDCTTGEFQSEIAFSQPHGVFSSFQAETTRALRKMKASTAESSFRSRTNSASANETSSGAYVQI